MPFAKYYEIFDVGAMLRGAEGAASPLTGMAGHSRMLHATSAGGTGGATMTAMLDRVTKRAGESNSQFKNRGGTGKTGAFATQVLQISAATQALNSVPGQAALAVLDDATHAGSPLRIVMTIPITKEFGFMPASGAPSYASVSKNDAAVTRTQASCSINMIIDRGAGGTTLQIQTCYPVDGVGIPASWTVTNFSTKVVVAQG
ncbi:hypothetical protein [Loktanella sp. M215]|uniref:hypothetical protein n=1 Tax=Loktanella sp. M215 TaxID=2675431 RepID=UPI001F39FE45|nr:hypothetical protein [Loktanella sp. M215]MCF7699907.1 hypothetical protein [Loktanella sp. M215]